MPTLTGSKFAFQPNDSTTTATSLTWMCSNNEARLEQQHRRGYEKHPAGAKEFSAWENEQAWAAYEESL